MGIGDWLKNAREEQALARMARQGEKQLAKGEPFGNNKPAANIEERITADAQGDKLKSFTPSRHELGEAPHRPSRGRRGSPEGRRNRAKAEQAQLDRTFETGIASLKEGTSHQLGEATRKVLDHGLGKHAESRYKEVLREAYPNTLNAKMGIPMPEDIPKHKASLAREAGTKPGAPYSKEDAHGMAIIENTLRGALAGQRTGGEAPSPGRAPTTPAAAADKPPSRER